MTASLVRTTRHTDEEQPMSQFDSFLQCNDDPAADWQVDLNLPAELYAEVELLLSIENMPSTEPDMPTEFMVARGLLR